ncbi:MAG TPA: phosphotransferase [Frankiaceae bacterium]|nr:phosphotransferase [Frankiaceae bacterium]
MVTARQTTPRRGHGGDDDVAVKHFAAADTEALKCWGSGHANERVAARAVAGSAPEVVGTWSDDAGDHLAYRWVHGTPLRPGGEAARAAGELLREVHATTGPWWGSLDGRFVFEDPVAALSSRFGHAVRLVAGVDEALARALERWGDAALGELVVAGPPRLVHGDFGPANLVETTTGLVALDWEHARWGHPAEDWAKIRLGLRFAEPNAFDAARWPTGDLLAGYGDEAARHVADGALTSFLVVYYAATLGAFFEGRPNPRLDWIRDGVAMDGAGYAVG